MNYPIDRLHIDKVTYRGRMTKVVFDAEQGLWTGVVVWRSPETCQKAAVKGADLNALTAAAIRTIAPA